MDDRTKVLLSGEQRAVFSVSLYPAALQDRGRLQEALVQLCQQIPGLRVSEGPDSLQTVLVTGELQLEMVLDQLRHVFGLNVRPAPPKLVYLEPIVLIETSVPDAFGAAVVNELKRRAIDVEQGPPAIRAYCSPRNLLGFKAFLASLTDFKDTYYSVTLAYYKETITP
jgi:translation elongation factor EF-G